MSRNKLIYYLHKYSGVTFSVLRCICKKNKWDIDKSYGDVFGDY